MTQPVDPRLERSVEATADGDTLDWDREAAQAPELGGRIAGLHALRRIAEAYERSRADHARSAGGAGSAALETPVFEWGFLRALSRIGEGSFGEVWRAWDTSLEREVALKLRRLTLGHGGVAQSDSATRRALDEARRLARVRHPHVLTVFGAAEHDGRAGVWTELIRGESLEQRLARTGPLVPREAASIGVDLCGALAAVHAAGLLHGDIKAANVMVETLPTPGARPRVVLMDFGAAHERATGGQVTGTPLLMAPEVLEGHPASTRSDLYSVGALLHQLTTGRYPIEADTLDGLRAGHSRGARTPASRAGRDAAALARVVERALAPNVAERHPDAGAMRRALLTVAAPRSRSFAIAAAVVIVAGVAAGMWWREHAASENDFLTRAQLPGHEVGAPLVPSDTLTGTLGSGLGWHVATAGDVNGDGLADVLVGSIAITKDIDGQGRVQLYLGRRDGRFGTPAEEWYGDQPQVALGGGMCVADVDGDGHPDLLLGDYWHDPVTKQAIGSVLVYRGRAGGFESRPSQRILGTQAGALFGANIAVVGDVDRDGFQDVVVTAVHQSDRYTSEGALFLYRGSPHGLIPQPAWTAYGGSPSAELGWFLDRVGDVNGDGYADIVAGAPGWTGKKESQGRVLVYFGGPGGPRARPDWEYVSDQGGSVLGRTVIGTGDLDHDGCDDFMVSQYGWSGRSAEEGRVLVFLGGRHGIPKRTAWVASGYGTDADLGSAIAAPGDMNGDGRTDLVTGAFRFTDGHPGAAVGLVTVHLVGLALPRAQSVWRMQGNDKGTPIGESLVSIGDYNGDGLADLLVTQPRYPTRFASGRGRVFLVLGRRDAAVR
jgi:Protein kinase domain/FG-GAP-like repeat/FG-GAP repeat